MATLLLSAAGAAIGGGFGGSVLGLSGAVIGRAVGATLGQAIDRRLLGSGSKPVETGKVDRFRLTGAAEGAAIGRVWGRMRVGGQVIWASRFRETSTTSGGGKGAPSQPGVTEYSYTVSLAIALCEGEIRRVGRIWADGRELNRRNLNLRVYAGSETQLPDPKIEAVEGAGLAPAYRGIAYVVIEDLDLEKFGNRVPQFSFEVFRPARNRGGSGDLAEHIRAVALVPGSGEYSLATTQVHYDLGLGRSRSANVHSKGGGTDFAVSVNALDAELPNCGAVSLVVSWFGDDLRCGDCTIRPKVEDRSQEGAEMAWSSGGITRPSAREVAHLQGSPAYGGTPADLSVIEAIDKLNRLGKKVMFYPFILMDQVAGNGLPDPWGGHEQPAFPWRGRITTSLAPGLAGSPDGTAQAAAEVAAFFGTAGPGDFSSSGATIQYSGPNEWSYRRFILHNAHLCKVAGGVEAFCIGSEMRSLTQVRGAGHSFPAVQALRDLAADVRQILGAGARIGYAADWSEYFGYQPGGGDRYFHLDPLWSDGNVDFVGIDNYMPISDWRGEAGEADAAARTVNDLAYLRANVEGGEGFDWYYASDQERAAQTRTPITDGSYGEPWVWRYKDIRNWWSNEHFERIGGVRMASPTAWVPMSKPIWFTEYGCPAVDKGSNEPNKFVDPKSSESGLPFASTGQRDDFAQLRYFQAMSEHWADPANNPVSPVYGGAMIDQTRAFAWTWDARPFPEFPARPKIWSDAANYQFGHVLTGRAASQTLASVVSEICEAAGLKDFDVSGLFGVVRGYQAADLASARSALQPLLAAYDVEVSERDGKLVFATRGLAVRHPVASETTALDDDDRGGFEFAREADGQLPGRVQLTYVESELNYETRAVESVFPDASVVAVGRSEFPLALTSGEALGVTDRWLRDARTGGDTCRFALPPSRSDILVGDVVEVETGGGLGTYRVERIERGRVIEVDAVRVQATATRATGPDVAPLLADVAAAQMPVLPLFLDLPLMTGNEDPVAPHLAVAADPWPGEVVLYASDNDYGYVFDKTVGASAIVGTTLTDLLPARTDLWDRGAALRVVIGSWQLASAAMDEVLAGANLAAIGTGAPDGWELFQFASADLVAPDIYDLALRLRGRFGTEAAAELIWPAGSQFVVINGALAQATLSLSQRGVDRHYRIGPADLPHDDPVFRHVVAGFEGRGLAPYSPVHLRARRIGGDIALDWVRRSRIGGDSWLGQEIPLGEAYEAYRLRVVAGAVVRRSVDLAAPAWVYTQAEQAQDGVAGPFEVEVAQVSDVYGPGVFRRIVVDV